MAAAWITRPTREAVQAAARGLGRITRNAVEMLVKELRAGRLNAWSVVNGKSVLISPERWRSIDIVLARKHYTSGFLTKFGQLTLSVSAGVDRPLHKIMVSGEAVRQLFLLPSKDQSPHCCCRTGEVARFMTFRHKARSKPSLRCRLNLRHQKRKIAARLQRAELALDSLFGDDKPAPSKMDNGTLCKEVIRWLKEHHPLPKGSSEISNTTILRAAGRAK